MLDATFATPDLTTFCRLEELGLEAVGLRPEPDRAVLACRVIDVDDGADGWCRRCGSEGAPRDSVTRQLAHEPLGWRPTMLLVTVRQYRCAGCGHVWRQDTTRAAESRAKISRRGLQWALEGLVVQHLSIARVAAGLGVAWDTANDAVLAEGKRVLIDNEHRFDGVAVIGVDEHVWRHTRRGDKYVTVIIDLTPVREGRGPSRLPDMVPGRSKAVFKTWLAARPQAWRDGPEVVAMDGFTGFKTAAAEEVPAAVAVMDPFHVVRLAGEAVDLCRRRFQQDPHGHRGRTGDPLYSCRRTLHTGAGSLTDRQIERIQALFAVAEHVPVEAIWGIYQRMITAYREPDRGLGKAAMAAVIDTLARGIPDGLEELPRLGRTLKQRAADVLAYFDNPGTSNGATEAINGRLEHLRGSALGFRNLTNYIARSLLETGASDLSYTLDWDEPLCTRLQQPPVRAQGRGSRCASVNMGVEVEASPGGCVVSWHVGDLPPRASVTADEEFAVFTDENLDVHSHASTEASHLPMLEEISGAWKVTARGVDHVFQGEITLTCRQESGDYQVWHRANRTSTE